MTLSRWRALPNGFIGWVVQDENKTVAPEPCVFPDHQPAQDRADELNRAETYARIGVPDPRTR